MSTGGDTEQILDALTSATRSKLRLFALVGGLVGLIFTLVAGGLASFVEVHASWLAFIGKGSFEAVGGAVLSSSVILVAFEQYVRRQSQAIESARAANLLAEYESRLVGRLPQLLSVGDQATVDAIARTASPEQLRSLGVKALGAALGSPPIVEASVRHLSERLAESQEVWHGLRIHMSMRPTIHPQDTDSSYFDINIIASFSSADLGPVALVCTSDIEEYRNLVASGRYVWVWYHEPTKQFPKATHDVFSLVECIVNGKASETGYSETGNTAYYQALKSWPEADNYEVRVTLRARIQRRGHCLYFNVPRVCDYVRYDYDYSGCGVAFVTVLDALGAPRRPVIERLPGANERVVVEMGDWTFPNSGVVFVWVLEAEMKTSFATLLSRGNSGGNSRG